MEASISHYNGSVLRAPNSALYPLLGGLYLAILMDRYEVTQTPHTIALHSGLYIDIIMYRYEGPQTPITLALLEASTKPL
jgi:hypothetical protein